MTDWRAIANATIPGLSAREVDRLVETLQALEENFRPLAERLTPELEPATGFRIPELSE